MAALSELATLLPEAWAFSKSLASLKAFVDLFVSFFHLGLYLQVFSRHAKVNRNNGFLMEL